MKKLTVFVLAIVFILFTAGCNGNAQLGETAAPVQTTEAAIPLTPTATPAVSVTYIPSVPPVETPSVGEEVTYTGDTIKFKYFDAEKNKSLDAEYNIEGSPNENTAFDAVNELYLKKIMGLKDVKVNSIKYSEGNVFVDFTESIYNTNLGSESEVGILDAIADAYFTNIEDTKAIYYTVNGSEYISGHLELPTNQPYKIK